MSASRPSGPAGLGRVDEAEGLADGVLGWAGAVAGPDGPRWPGGGGRRTAVAPGGRPEALAGSRGTGRGWCPAVAGPRWAGRRPGRRLAGGAVEAAAVVGRGVWSAGAVAGLNVATDSIAPATRHTARMLASSGMTVPRPANGAASRRSRFRRRFARSSRW